MAAATACASWPCKHMGTPWFGMFWAQGSGCAAWKISHKVAVAEIRRRDLRMHNGAVSVLLGLFQGIYDLFESTFGVASRHFQLIFEAVFENYNYGLIFEKNRQCLLRIIITD